VLVLPRIVALVLVMPLLTIVANAMGLAGGALLTSYLLDLPWSQFVLRLDSSIAATTLWAGLVKALITDSVARVDQGSQLVDQAGATMTQIVDHIRHVGEMIERVSLASQEQSTGVGQVGQHRGEVAQGFKFFCGFG
jgi:membrane protein implicated in regulation of membrane protease activity